MIDEKIPKYAYVEDMLDDLNFVNWDRFIYDDADDTNPILRFYGWIKREKDSYKDFVVIDYWPRYGEISFITSSDKYSQIIDEILFGKRKGHLKCNRVEHHYNIPNSIKLGEIN